MKVARIVVKIEISREWGVLPFSAASDRFFAVGASVLLSLSSSAKSAALRQRKRPLLKRGPFPGRVDVCVLSINRRLAGQSNCQQLRWFRRPPDRLPFP